MSIHPGMSSRRGSWRHRHDACGMEHERQLEGFNARSRQDRLDTRGAPTQINPVGMRTILDVSESPYCSPGQFQTEAI